MNMLGTLLLSLGTPMLLAGDEFGNSQNGNNNAYTQDNETTWLDWDWLYSTEQTAELKLFNLTSRLIALRKARDLYNHEDFFTRLSKIGLLKKSDRVHWFLPNGKTPHDADWTNPSVRSRSWPSSMRKRRTNLPGDSATICSVSIPCIGRWMRMPTV